MNDAVDYKPAAATPSGDLYRDLMNPNISKSEREHFAARRIADLEAELARLKAPLGDDEDLPAGMRATAEWFRVNFEPESMTALECEAAATLIERQAAALAAPVDADVEELAQLLEAADEPENAALVRRLSRENAALREGVEKVRADIGLLARFYYGERTEGLKEALAILDKHFPKPSPSSPSTSPKCLQKVQRTRKESGR